MPGPPRIRRLDLLIVVPMLLAAGGCGPQVVAPGTSAPAATRTTPAQNAEPSSGAVSHFENVPTVPAASVLELPPPAAAHYHEVKPGETLSGIARRYGTSLEALVDANGLDAAAPIQPGQLIYIP